MTYTKNKLELARKMVAELGAKGAEVSLGGAWKLLDVVAIAAGRIRDDAARAAREERVRTGMVARWCSEMRAVGGWDGE
jgi:hypothetical protein